MIDLVLRHLGRSLVTLVTASFAITTTGVTVVAAPSAGLRLVVLDGEGSASAVGTAQWLAGASPLTGAMVTGVGSIVRVPAVLLPEDTALVASVTGVGAGMIGWVLYGTARV